MHLVRCPARTVARLGCASARSMCWCVRLCAAPTWVGEFSFCSAATLHFVECLHFTACLALPCLATSYRYIYACQHRALTRRVLLTFSLSIWQVRISAFVRSTFNCSIKIIYLILFCVCVWEIFFTYLLLIIDYFQASRVQRELIWMWVCTYTYVLFACSEL